MCTQCATKCGGLENVVGRTPSWLSQGCQGVLQVGEAGTWPSTWWFPYLPAPVEVIWNFAVALSLAKPFNTGETFCRPAGTKSTISLTLTWVDEDDCKELSSSCSCSWRDDREELASSTSCRWLVAVTFRSPSDHDRFFWQKAEPAQRMAPFGSLLSLSFSLLFPTHNGFNNIQLNMMASEPFFYQCVLMDARHWSTEFYCSTIPTDRTAFGIRTWPRPVLHVGARLVFFGGDGVWAKCHSNLAMPRLAWLVFCWWRPFVLFNEDAFLCDPAQKKKIDFADLFRPVGGGRGSSEPLWTPYSYAPVIF